jgi:DmsE family decaheme c-type cytochrome
MRSNHVPLPFLTAVALILFVAIAVPGAAAPQQPAAPRPPDSSAPTYVGSEMCASCHADVAENLTKTPHGKSVFAGLSVHGCETCHGPGSKHVEDPDVVENRPIITKWSARQQSELCQSCHKGSNQFFWHGSVHESRGLSCVSCHSIHAFKSEKAQLKATSTVETCVSCHKTVRAEMWKNSHHPIREGKISCADCHNPHGSATPKMIKQASVNDQCYTCHTEKRGTFVWEHAPVRESCLNCHTPHGSNHLKLQKTSVPYLCQQCHANTRHPGTLYDGTTLADAGRASNRLFNRACLDCHATIHGSNHPSSPYLGH